MDTDGFPEPTPDAVALHSIAGLLGDGEADARLPAIIAVRHFQQEKPPAALFTTPDGQELRAFAKPLRSNAPGLAGFRQGFTLPLRRTAACGRGCGVRRPLRGHPWWPCAHGNRAGACGRAWRVDRCASFVLIPRRAALLGTVAMNRSCAGHGVAQSKLRRTDGPSVSGLIERRFGEVNSRLRSSGKAG